MLSYEDLNAKNDDNKLSIMYNFLNGYYTSLKETNMIQKYISDQYKKEYTKIYYVNGSNYRMMIYSGNIFFRGDTTTKKMYKSFTTF
jgi:hypothetical protein